MALVQSTELSLKCVVINAGESLDIDGKMLREPFGFSDIIFPAQSTQLGCEGNNNEQGTRALNRTVYAIAQKRSFVFRWSNLFSRITR